MDYLENIEYGRNKNELNEIWNDYCKWSDSEKTQERFKDEIENVMQWRKEQKALIAGDQVGKKEPEGLPCSERQMARKSRKAR